MNLQSLGNFEPMVLVFVLGSEFSQHWCGNMSNEHMHNHTIYYHTQPYNRNPPFYNMQ